MGFVLTSKDYAEYLKSAQQKIAENRDYITSLDAATGDGDHWVNINMGFSALVEISGEFADLTLDATFKKIGSVMMNKVGGSSGILYGGAYMSAAKLVTGKQSIGCGELCGVLDAMCADMMKRGKAEPGFKTIIDALYPAVQVFKAALGEGKSEADIMAAVCHAALEGAESTRAMEAVKGRASYQTDKGVGHLDPGAVTMSYQLECLCGYITENLI